VVAIVTGAGLGLERSSAFVLGSGAQLGSANLGRGGDGVYVNAATGNLIISNRDEFLIGRGPDSVINRTYNSRGLLNDDNQDNWRMSTHRRVFGLSGTLNATGSSVWRTDWDGSDVLYSWNGSAYVSTEGAGAYDTIIKSGNNWIWTDGDSQYSEVYDDSGTNGGRIAYRRDTERDSGGIPTNVIIYGYDGSGRLNRVTTADGNFTDLVWDNTAGKTNNLLMLTTSFTDTQTNTTKYLTRTRYSYDSLNRLETVTVDLSPEHANGASGTATADGRVYTTTYSYDGSSKRVASIAQTDGSLLAVTYVLVDGAYRIATFAQTVETGVTRVTNFAYNSITRTTTITDPAGVVTSLTYDSSNHLVRQSVTPVGGGNEQITTYGYSTGAAARNLLLRSAAVNNSSWLKTTTIVDGANTRTAPNNNATPAPRITFGAAGGNVIQNLSSMVNGARYIADIWVYSATATTVSWGILEGSQAPASYAVAANVWTRLRAETVFTAGSTLRRVELGGTSNQVIWATQAQVRHDSDPDIYVATTTTPVTSITDFGSTDDVTVIRRFDGAANEMAGNWIEREDLTYDLRGNLIKRVDGAGNTTEYSYNATNQRETATQYLTPDPDGVAGSGVASNPTVTRYIYDDGGSNGVTDHGSTYVGSDITDVAEQHLRFIVSAEGRVTEYRYNAAGQMIASISYTGTIYSGALPADFTERKLSDWVEATADKSKIQRVDYVYDFRGNIKQETRWSRTTSAGVGDTLQDWSRTEYIYDQYGLQLSKLESGITAGFWTPTPVAKIYAYDGMGRVISFTDSGSNMTRTSYLDAQSKTQIVFANGAITTTSYNRAGELVSSIETIGVAQLNVLPQSIVDWTTTGDRENDNGNGPPRSRITIKNNTHYSVTSSPTNVVAGDQITWRITLRQIGTLSTTELWAWATASGYGTADLSAARIVDGPGNVASYSPGKFTLQGLSQTDYTTIEVTRIFTQAESYVPQIYTSMGSIPSANSQGIIVQNDMAVTKTGHALTQYKYDNLGRLRVATGPTGVKSYFVYDQAGRKVGEVDGDGSLTEYIYDAADRVIASVRYATAVSSANIADLANPSIPKTIANIRPSSLSADRWSWNIYDKAGQLIQTIDAAGAVGVLNYDGAGRLTSTTRYATALSTDVVNGTNGISGYRTTPPAQFALTLPAADAATDRVARNYYDKDGLLIASLDEDGYLTEYIYDTSGRKVETIGYAMQAGHTLAEASRPAHWQSATLATLKATADDNPSADIHNYWIYDGRGHVVATINGEGNVTRFVYSPAGDILQEVRGQQVTPNTSYTIATLPAATGTLDVTNYSYNAKRELLQRERLLNGRNETTDYVYDSMGRLVSETVTEGGSSDTRTQRSRYDLGGRLIGSLGGVGSATLSATPTDAQLAGAIDLHGTRFVYDAAGRLTQKITPQGTNAAGIKTVYYYDQDGQLRYEVNALGEVTEYKYNVLEDRIEGVVYATPISTTGLSGGLLTGPLAAVIASTASSIAQATTGGSGYDSRTQYSYTNRGELFLTYNPLYPTAPTQSNYNFLYYNMFGDVKQSLIPTDMPAYHWNNSSYAYNRRGLAAGKQWLLNGSATGARYNSYGHDAFGRIAVEHTNSTDWRYLSYQYDRANRLSYSYDRTAAATNFVYDARSNLISQTDRSLRTTTFAYDQFNRSVTTTTAEGIATTVRKNAYGQTIEITTPGVHFQDGLARTTRYTYDKNGNLDETWEAWGTAQQRKVADNDYDYANRLTKITDARGVATTYSYDAAGRVLTEVRDAGSGTRSIAGLPATYANITTAYAYDAKGQQIQVTDGRGTVTKFEYDLKGQQTRVVQDYGTGLNPQGQPFLNLTTEYSYRADGKVVAMTEGVGTAAARTTAYEYDSLGRLLKSIIDPDRTSPAYTGLKITVQYVYDVNDNVVATIDERNFVTRNVYDKENRLVLSVNALGEVIENGYDGEGRTIWTRSYANRIATTTIDGWANEVPEATVRAALVASADKDHIVRTLYDGDGRRKFAVDGEGYVSGFAYDGANNITRTVVFADKLSSTALQLNDGHFSGFNIAIPPTTASITKFEYDAANRLTKTIDAENYSELYGYDAAGNRISFTNKLGGVTEFEYDPLGRLRSEKVIAPVYDSEGVPVASSYYTAFYEYDAVGNVVRQIAGQKNYLNVGAAAASDALVTSFEYDRAGRLEKRTDPTLPGNSASVTRFEYDARGNVILQTNADLGKIYSYYDAAGRKIGEISPVNTLTRWTYMASGNVESMKVYATAVATPASVGGNPPAGSGDFRETQYGYDRINRLTTTTVMNVRTGGFNGTNYVTNASQNLVSRVDYDAFGNVIKETDANLNAVYHWYDRNGREIYKVDQEQYLTAWVRDEDGNVISETRRSVQIPVAVSNSSNPVTLFASYSSAADRITEFEYDKNGRRTVERRLNVEAAAAIAGPGNPVISQQTATIGYSYNGLGLVTQKVEANGDTINYDYDNQGRLTRQRDPLAADFNANGTATVRHATWFFYDALGNLVRTQEKAENAAGSGYASGYAASDDRIMRYQYSGGKQTWSMDASGFVRNFEYDIMGRQTREYYARLKANGTTDTARNGSLTSYDVAGRVTAQQLQDYTGNVWTTRGPVTGFTYNSFGEVITRSMGGVTIETNSYDNAGRVIKTNSGDGVWKFMVYDAGGNATLSLSAAGGTDVSAYTQDSAVAAVLGLGGNAALSGFTQAALLATVATYDRRGMALSSHQPGRTIADSANVANNITATLSSSRNYNAFGEVASETDARGNITDFTYNAMGRLVKKEAPLVSVTSEAGVASNIRPTELYAYDRSGRMVAMQDANQYGIAQAQGFAAGKWTTRVLLAGTGHEGPSTGSGEALTVKEYRPDGSMWETRYDGFGDARVMLDGLGRSTSMLYDKQGRVTQITRPATTAGTLIESYGYDGLGQRLKSWNNGTGVTFQESLTDYDIQGRVISQTAAGGDVTSISYAWNASFDGAAIGLWGWEETTTYANLKSSIAKTDAFGRELAKKDMGGRHWRYVYDQAGRMTEGGRVASAASASIDANNRTQMAWYNSGLTQSITTTASGIASTESYGYDAGGNRVRESAAYKNATASYDALNRITRWDELGTATLAAAWTITAYDANGNIRRTQARYSSVTATGGFTAPTSAANVPVADYWYRYDAVNRVVVDRGVLTGAAGAGGTTIARISNAGVFNERGAEILYNAAGERMRMITSMTVVQNYRYFVFYPGAPYGVPDENVNGNYHDAQISFTGFNREDYERDAAGRVKLARTVTSQYEVDDYGTLGQLIHPTGPGNKVSEVQYDLLGRMVQDSSYIAGRVNPSQSRTVFYNAKNQISSDEVSTWRGASGPPGGDDEFKAVTTYDYGVVGTSSYALGGVVSQNVVNTKKLAGSSSWSTDPGTLTQTSYDWWDGAVQSAIHHDADLTNASTIASVTATGLFGSGTKVYKTGYAINGIGQLTSALVQDGIPKTLTYALDANGQIIRRDEARTSPPNGVDPNQAPHELYYRFAGKEMGMVGNDGTGDMDYEASVTARLASAPTGSNAGIYRGGWSSGRAYADFSQSIERYNANAQGSSGGSYTVRAGDTLQGIAAALWGDANLWYRLAEANGLSAQSALSEGQMLTLPAGVTKSTHNASTFQPYDASEALGDTLPTTPKPPKKPKCNVLGALILVAIAIAVTVVTAGAALSAATPGLSLGGGITAMLGGTATLGVGAGALAGTAFAGGLVTTFGVAGGIAIGAGTAALGSIASQGFGVATGLQDKFSWKGVGLAALGGGIGAGMQGLGDLANAGKLTGTLGKVGNLLRGSGIGSSLVRAVGANVLTQGIGAATGLQDRFSFAGVATAGVGAAVGHMFGSDLAPLSDNSSIGNQLAHASVRAVNLLANAGARSMIEGTSFGDNILAALPDMIVDTLGNVVKHGVVEEAERVKDEAGGKVYTPPAPVEEVVFGGGGIPTSVGGGRTLHPMHFYGQDGEFDDNYQTMWTGEPLVDTKESEPFVPTETLGYIKTNEIGGYFILTERLTSPLEVPLDGVDGGILFDGKPDTNYNVEIMEKKDGTASYRFTDPDGVSLVLRNKDLIYENGMAAGYITFEENYDPSNLKGWSIGSEEFNARLNKNKVAQSSDWVSRETVNWIKGDGKGVSGWFRMVAGDLATLPDDIADNGLGVLEGLPPTLGGGAKSVTEGVARGIGAVWKLLKPVASDNVAPLTKAAILAANAAKGRAFEEAGIRGILSHVGLGKNATAVTRNGVTTILDSAGRPAGLVEFKDVAYLTKSKQLTAQLAEARATGQPYNLVVSPTTQRISGPLVRQIERVNRQILRENPGNVTSGGIFRYDPATDVLTPY
jgi:YD repeat-containing protein